MAASTWSVLILTAPMLIGLAAAYPHRAYHDEADVQTPEKNVRHIDGLDVSEAQRQLQETVRRQVEDQVRQTGSGSASGQWSVSKISSYGGEGGSSSSGGAPVRATISGDILDGTGEGVITTNCHNCRMRIRKVGGASVGAGQYSSGQQFATGSEQVVSGAREYSSGAGQYSSGAGQYSSGAGQYSSGAGQYSSGAGHYSSGAGQYSSGGGQYSSGAGQHSSGAGRYSSGGGQYPSSSGVDQGVGGYQSVSSQSRYYSSSRDGGLDDGVQTSRYERPEAMASSGKSSRVTTKQSWDFSDLGYGTQDLQQIIQRLEEDLRAGRYENGKTVTTVTTTTSENGGVPVTRQETFVKDGAIVPQLPSLPALDGTAVIGRTEAEDLLQGFRDELRSGKTQAGKTVTTVMESSSANGGAPVVTKKTYVRDGFDSSALNLDSASVLGPIRTDADRAPGSHSVTKTTTSVWSSDGSGAPARGLPRFPGPVDHLGGGNLLTNSQKTTRNVTTVSSYSTTGAGGSSGQDIRAVDSLGGGHLIRESSGYGGEAKGVRRVDGLGGGHLIRESGGYGGTSSSYGAESSSLKETRRVDALGGGHLIRESGYGSDLKGTRRVDALGGGHLIRDTDQTALPTSDTMSVSQMPGYRSEDEVPAQGGISNSKYYNTFQSSSYKSGGVGDAATADAGRQTLGDTLGSSGSGSRSSSSSTYKKVVSYSSTGSADVLEELDGSHQGVPSRTSGSSSTQDVGGNLAFIHGEQQNGRIPEAGSGSYFSSSSQQQQQQQGVIGTQQGGKLTVSLADIGIIPSTSQGASQQSSYGSSSSSRHSTYESTGSSGYGGSMQEEVGSSGGGGGYGSSGSGYGGSGKLTAHGSRQYESVSGAPSGAASGYSWSSHSSYSSGTPSRVSSSYGDATRGGSYREQRRAQANGGPDCDGNVKI